MKRVLAVTGFILEGENEFYANETDAQLASVRAERFAMIKNGVGSKWYSDPVGSLLADEKLLQNVAGLKYTP